MFERSPLARRVVVLADEEARLRNDNYIGSEHILLGLIREGADVAAKALESLGISLDAVRRQVEEITGPGQYAPSGRIPFTPRAKKVLELALPGCGSLPPTTTSMHCASTSAAASSWPLYTGVPPIKAAAG